MITIHFKGGPLDGDSMEVAVRDPVYYGLVPPEDIDFTFTDGNAEPCNVVCEKVAYVAHRQVYDNAWIYRPEGDSK